MPTTPLLTPGDVEVFWWLWLLRVLTLDQVRRLRYYQEETGRLSSLDNVRKRLARLAQAGYLTGDQLHATRERVYFLAEKALGPLREHYGLEQQRLYKPRAGETLTQLRHPLMVSECAVRVLESVRGTEVEVPSLAPLGVPFYHTHAVGDPRRKKHTERYVTQEDLRVPGYPEPLRVRPDLVFGLAVGEARRLFLLEADRGFESPQEIGRKQLAYAYYRDAIDPEDPRQYRWQRYGDFQDFRVLIVTTTEVRMASLRKALQSELGFDLLAFGLFGEAQVKNLVFDPVWTALDGHPRAFLTRRAGRSAF